MSDPKKSKDAEDILSEFHGAHTLSESEPQLPSPESEPQLPSPESEPQLPSPESEPQLPSPESEPQLPSPESEPQLPSPETRHDPEERNVIFVGTKPIMTYVSATLTQLSTRQTVTIKARGKRITQAVDVSQMIVKRMNTVGYVISDVRILSDSLTSQDGKTRNVSTIEIDITKIKTIRSLIIICIGIFTVGIILVFASYSCGIQHISIMSDLESYEKSLDPEFCNVLVEKINLFNSDCKPEVEILDCG